jgi:2-desacetyl-2-hydroxyethyl bacteriochlorophyllide A dehydrogenase
MTAVRAISFPEHGRVELVDLTAPAAPQRDEVLVESAYLGICGSDLHVLHGRHPFVRPPVITGHEWVGMVVSAGPDAAFQAGERVAINPLVTCGHCRACRAGRFNHCEQARVLGFRMPGAAQTRFVTTAGQLHRIPDALDLRLAALAEPVAVGVHAAKRAPDRESVLVIGGGTIGLCVFLALKAAGADAVTVVEPRAEKRALARKLGAAATITPAEMRETATYTAVFDCVASQATLEAACRQCIGGGTVVVVGVADGPRQFALPRLQRFEIDLVGTGMYLPVDIDQAIQALADGSIDAAPLISAVRPFHAAPAAFAEAMHPENVKILIDMTTIN